MRRRRVWLAAVVIGTAALWGCGRMPIQDIELIGYEKGVKRMVYHSSIYHETLPDGAKGYRLETRIDYSVGAVDRRSYQRTTLMNSDFTLHSSLVERVRNGQKITTSFTAEPEAVVLRKEQDGELVSEDKIPIEKPVYGDTHPLLYAKQLTRPGAEGSYPVISEDAMAVRQVAIKHGGAATIDINGKKVRTVRYQIESASGAGRFDDYYIESKSKKLVKIDIEPIQFLAKK